ncbi:CsiV family protein [Pseudomonas sp. NA-150]|uniref:CsiV family protein n=1 Tax=Pseudomonas sp. NA-150 TaxID=3367525 RepID=UPI0037CC602B
MRLFRSLILLLTLAAPAAFADGLYQVEMILFRQTAEPATTQQFAPEDWAAGAQKITPENERSLALSEMDTKLDASGTYKVLLHRAWQQSLSATPSKMAVSSGQEHFGHFPIEGTVTLSLDRFTDIIADFWVNQLDNDGVLNTSERLTQTTRVKNGELTYIDNGGLAMLIKISPL